MNASERTFWAGFAVLAVTGVIVTVLLACSKYTSEHRPYVFTPNRSPGWHSVDVKTKHVDDVLDKLGPECDIKFTDGAYRGSTVIAYSCEGG